MQQSTRKKLCSVSIQENDVEILQKHAEKIRRSFSETIRLIVEEYIKKNNLKQKYPQA